MPPDRLVGTSGMRHGTMPPGAADERPLDLRRPDRFTRPDFALTVRMEGTNDRGVSRFHSPTTAATPGGGRYRLPLFGQKGRDGPHRLSRQRAGRLPLFLTASKTNGKEGRPFSARTTDGGLTWRSSRSSGPSRSATRSCPPRSAFADRPPGDDRPADGPAAELDRRLRLARRRPVLVVPSISRARRRRGEPAEPASPGRRPALPDLRLPRTCRLGLRARLSGDRARPGATRSCSATTPAAAISATSASVVRARRQARRRLLLSRPAGPDRYLAATIWDPGPSNVPTRVPDRHPLSPNAGAIAMRKTFSSSFAFLACLAASAVGGELKTERVFGPEVATGPYKHPACLAELDNGDLFLVYYGGEGEYATETAVFGSRRKPGEAGWSTPKPIASDPIRSVGNGVVWQSPDGLVWLFYVVRDGQTWSTSRVQFKVSQRPARDVVRRLAAGQRAGPDGPQPPDRPLRRSLPPARLPRDRPRHRGRRRRQHVAVLPVRPESEDEDLDRVVRGSNPLGATSSRPWSSWSPATCSPTADAAATTTPRPSAISSAPSRSMAAGPGPRAWIHPSRTRTRPLTSSSSGVAGCCWSITTVSAAGRR